jgi:hypothetical protein
MRAKTSDRSRRSAAVETLPGPDPVKKGRVAIQTIQTPKKGPKNRPRGALPRLRADRPLRYDPLSIIFLIDNHGSASSAYIRDALNAIAYRFTALAEYDESLRSLINAPDGQPFRYMQERDLFGFYSNAHSVFDAFCFALFAVGALIDPGNFPLATEADERNVTWSTMLRAYGKAFPTDPILSELEKIWNDTEELRGIRNILTHRAVGARDLMATTDPSAPSDRIPRLNISLDAGTTRTHRSQVAGLLLLGLEAADKFVKAHGAG